MRAPLCSDQSKVQVRKTIQITLRRISKQMANAIIMQWNHFNFPVMEGGLQNRDDKTMMRGILEPCSTCCNREAWKCLELLGDQPANHQP